MKKSLTRIFPAWGYVVVLSVVAALARMMISFFFSQNPSIMPDEALYFNLARSIWQDGAVSLRGQPLTYDSLLYPLILAPLNILSGQMDMFRLVQWLNAILISATIFPTWALARHVTGSERSALFVALLVVLMPDMAMSQIIMSESICYPLVALVLYLTYRAVGEDGRYGHVVGASVACALLYWAKPGYIAMGLALCAVLAVHWHQKRETKRAVSVGIALGIQVALMLLMRLFAIAMGVDYANQSIYQMQTSMFSFEQLIQTLQGSLLYVYFFVAAALAFPIIMPIANQRNLSQSNRLLLVMLIVAVLITILGTSYVIYVDEYTGRPFAARIHMRYLAGYLPAFFTLCLAPEVRNKKATTGALIGLALLLAASLVFTPEALLSNRSYPVDALTLSAVTSDWTLTEPKKLFQMLILIVVLAGGAYLLRKGWNARMRQWIFGALAACFLLSNVSAYDLMRHNNDALWAQDAREATQILRGKSAVSVAADGGYFWNASTALDVRMDSQMPVVELDDLIENTQAGGVFGAFLPRSYWTTYSRNMVERPNYLVMDNQMLYGIALASNVRAHSTTNGKYALIEWDEGQPWVYSALSGMGIGYMPENATLTVFDSSLCGQETLLVSFKAGAVSNDTRLVMEVNGQRGEFALSTQTGDFEWRVAIPGDGQPVVIELYAPQGAKSLWIDEYSVAP